MLASLFVTVALSVLGLAVPNVQKRALATVYSRCTVPNTAALTFDDGPYIYGKDIVNLLDRYGAKGTFFYNGNNWRCIYDTDMASNVKYAYDHGHQVASHTWAHKDLATLTWDQIHDEMWRVEQALSRITGANPAFMRPPYGSYNDLVRSASDVRGQDLVIWDLDSGDSSGQPVSYQKAQYDSAVNRHPSTILSLEHETYETTAHQTVEYAINRLQGAGYRLVTVAECLGQNPYQSVAAPQPRNADWHC